LNKELVKLILFGIFYKAFPKEIFLNSEILSIDMTEVKNQLCSMCGKKTMELREEEREVPFFGKVYIFSVTCTSCKYHKADVEVTDKNEPCKYTLEIDGEEDMKIRVIKSSQATVKIPHVITIEPGTAGTGYISNVEGILKRVKHVIETARDSGEDKSARKKAKKLLRKLNNVIWGKEKLKLIIVDPSGNSAIVSEKAKKSKP